MDAQNGQENNRIMSWEQAPSPPNQSPRLVGASLVGARPPAAVGGMRSVLPAYTQRGEPRRQAAQAGTCPLNLGARASCPHRRSEEAWLVLPKMSDLRVSFQRAVWWHFATY